MIERIPRIKTATEVEIIRGGGMIHEITPPWGGVYEIEHWRGNRLLNVQTVKNAIPTEGKRYTLDILSHGGTGDYYTVKTTWYVILAGNGASGGAPTTAPSLTAIASWTYDNHQTYITEFRDFTDGNNGNNATTRPVWTHLMDATLASTTSNANKGVFNIVAASANTGKIFGAGLVTRVDKNDHTAGDYLLSYANFTSSIDVVNGDVVKVGVSVGMS